MAQDPTCKKLEISFKLNIEFRTNHCITEHNWKLWSIKFETSECRQNTAGEGCSIVNTLISLRQQVFLPAGLEKSSTLVAGCSRSGLLDDRLPGMGMMATLWRHCLVPTMLSSWDWPMPPSLERKAGMVERVQQDEGRESEEGEAGRMG